MEGRPACTGPAGVRDVQTTVVSRTILAMASALSADGPAARRRNRYRTPGDILLALRTLAVAMRAQRAREVPLPELLEQLAGRPGPSCGDVDRARAAAGRALRLLRLATGSLDTCLMRALTVGRLLAPHHRVHLCLGFRPAPGGRPADGHAWLKVDGRELQVAVPPEGTPYEPATEIPFPGTMEA